MADPATVEPDPDLETPAEAGDGVSTYTLQAAPEQAGEPVPEQRSQSRGRPRAVPLLVHGTNATGIAVGVAYAVAGVPGLVAAGLAGAAVGIAALSGSDKRSKASAARKAARAGGAGSGSSRAGGGAGRSLTGRGGRGSRVGGSGRTRGGPRPTGTAGTGSAGQRPGAGRSAAPGSTARGGKSGRGLGGLKGRPSGLKKRAEGGNSPGASTPKGSGGKGAGTKGSSGRAPGSGKAWQTVKGWAGKARRAKSPDGTNGTGEGSAGGSTSGTGGGTGATRRPASRRGRLWQKIRNGASRLRRHGTRASATGGTAAATAAARTRHRVYRMRRLVVRRLGHWTRCAGAGALAALGSLLTLPLGLLWGTARLFTNHRDPLGAFAYPVRVAGRIWRFLLRRSQARHDKEAQADQLNLDVNDPRKDSDVSGPLVSGTTVLDGNSSKFALAMRAAYSTYTTFHPRSMMEVAAEYAGLPNAIRSTAAAVQYMTVNADQKYPCSKRAIAKLGEAFRVLMTAASRADDMNTLFRSVHAFDIERIVTPRTNEWMWNVTPAGSHAPEGAMFMPGRIEAGCVLMGVLYRTYEPVHMMQVGSEFQGISYGLAALADAIDTLRERTRDLYPVDDRVLHDLSIIVGTVRAAADYADMAAKLFLEDHRLEISHNTNPRKGPAAESMWNTPR